MTDPVNADRRARAALTCLPPDRHRTQRIHRHGPITVWERIAGCHPDIDPDRLLERATEDDWWLVIPGDPDWPAVLDVPGQPLGLWVNGAGDLPGLLRRAVTLTGARTGSAYGRTVAADLATDLTTQPGGESVTVVAHGGGNGADVAALTSAARRPAAIAVLDTPTDLIGQHDLLRAIAATGVLVSTAAPGAHPTPGHVLARIELLASLAHATVLIDARASDDDALAVAYTAHHRRRRPVLAIPGPITAPASAGPHALIREGTARCVTTAGHITAHLPDPPTPH